MNFQTLSGISWCGRFKQKNTFKKKWLTKTAMEKDECGEKQHSRVCEVSWWWCWQNMEVMLIGRGYGKEWSRWFAIPITSTFLRDYYLQYTNFLSLINKELVIVSVAISCPYFVEQEEIKAAPVLARLHCSVSHWHSLSWLTGWSKWMKFRKEW